MITIVDYNMGNLGSIRNMLKRIGVESEITADVNRIAGATKLILPGVGAFDAGIEALASSGVLPALSERVLEARVPVLGICLGMQLMTSSSEEGARSGLGWVDARCVRFAADASLKVPHMGWNLIEPVRGSALLDGLPEESRFYFVHSYQVSCKRPDDVLLISRYGGAFHAAFQVGNVWGVQFHPEKSHKFGMRLLQNFAERC